LANIVADVEVIELKERLNLLLLQEDIGINLLINHITCSTTKIKHITLNFSAEAN
jgi:hypothetical protein